MKSCRIFIDMILEEKFVEAHEVLEEDWKKLKKTKPITSNILKGFINAATALALYKRGNQEGFKRVWKTFLKYESLIDKHMENADILYEIRELLHIKKQNLVE